MAPGNNTLKYCNCCKQFITKGAELVHRRAMFTTLVELERLDIHLYSLEGSLNFVDITSIQALVARVLCSKVGSNWAIVDRSGSLARAVFNNEDGN